MPAKFYTVGGNIATLQNNTTALYQYNYDPYNPLDLPPNIVRVRTNDGNAPNNDYASYETATLVPGTSDVYDVYKSGTDFSALLSHSANVIEVLGANTTGITNMSSMFSECASLTTITLFDTSSVTSMENMLFRCISLTSLPLFDTSNVVSMQFMCGGCHSITSIPLFNTSNVGNMRFAFMGCNNVESGALALYQQASTQTNPPSDHNMCFRTCGSDTITGAAELAQIPDDWK